MSMLQLLLGTARWIFNELFKATCYSRKTGGLLPGNFCGEVKMCVWIDR